MPCHAHRQHPHRVPPPPLPGGSWALAAKHYFNQRGAKVSACDYHRGSGLLVVGYTNGLFDLHQLPDFSNIHTLSISRERITAMAFSPVGAARERCQRPGRPQRPGVQPGERRAAAGRQPLPTLPCPRPQAGDWIAIGCAKLGQLLVWEWRSETWVCPRSPRAPPAPCPPAPAPPRHHTCLWAALRAALTSAACLPLPPPPSPSRYVLKQQGHYFDVSTAAFSPDGALVATGADDCKVRCARGWGVCVWGWGGGGAGLGAVWVGWLVGVACVAGPQRPTHHTPHTTHHTPHPTPHTPHPTPPPPPARRSRCSSSAAASVSSPSPSTARR
jgi:hypothetical protein